MNFTVFLNSRGRVQQLQRFIESFEKHTYNHAQLEMIITGDNDDTETVQFLNELRNRKTFTFNPIIGDRPTSLCASFNNMAKKAQGRYLFVLNDDAEILTPNWDEIALRKIKEYQEEWKIKDNVIYGRTADNSVDKVAGKLYASFPIISAQAVEGMGFFMHEEFVGLGGDSAIYRVYEQINRVVDMSEIQLDHVYHNHLFRVLSPDKTAHEMRVNSHQHNLDPFTLDVSNDVERMKIFLQDKQ
jgi:glycosyltransferase involved in cell wall biosynthesis